MGSAGVILREERIGNQRLLLGDSAAILPGLGRFDAVLCDPPYGIKRDGKPRSTSSHGGHKGYPCKGWDDKAPNADTIRALIAAGTDAIIWGANYFPEALPPSSGWLFWDKGQRIDQADGELAFSTRPDALRVFTLNRAALARDGAVHPTQKSLALMEWCLTFLPKAQTILDPFAGSFTTLCACQKMGKQGTGIEIDPDYFEAGCRRVEAISRQPDMFVAQTPTLIQEQLL